MGQEGAVQFFVCACLFVFPPIQLSEGNFKLSVCVCIKGLNPKFAVLSVPSQTTPWDPANLL